MSKSGLRNGARKSVVAGPAVADLYRANVRCINEYPLEDDELEFIGAINAYKQRHNRPFPTWSEVLHVVKFLGYRKPAQAASDPPIPSGS